MSIKMIDLGWVAGFLEGEGSFSFLAEKDPRVTAVQVESDPLEKLVSLFGGKIYPKKTAGYGKKPVQYWNLGGSHAAALMMTLYPLMSVKRQTQIRRALIGWKSKGAKFGAHHYSAVMDDAEAVEVIKRILHGESMSSIAREKHISHATISMWMKGANRPEIRTQLGDLAAQIKVSSTGQNHYKVTVSDADALIAMRRIYDGESMYSVAREIGITSEAMSFWMRGLKRPYLLARLQQEALSVSSDKEG